VTEQILNRKVDELESDLTPVFLGNADPGRLGVQGSPEDWVALPQTSERFSDTALARS
jgi:hypothetical protein